jgi:hypothetical protein
MKSGLLRIRVTMAASPDLDELRRVLSRLAGTTINLKSKIFIKSGLLGIRATLAASPDLMNFGASSVDLPVRRST